MSSGFPAGTPSVWEVAQPAWSVALQVRSSNTETVPVRAGAVIGHVHGVGARVDGDRGRERPDGDRWRCCGAPGGMVGVAVAGVDHRDGVRDWSRRRRCRRPGSPAMAPALDRYVGYARPAAAGVLRVAKRRVDHRDRCCRPGWRCTASASVGSRATDSGSAPVWISGGWSVAHADRMASVADVGVDHDERVVLLVGDVHAVVRSVHGDPDTGLKAGFWEWRHDPGRRGGATR